MASEEDKITDGINKPLLTVAGVLVVVGLILSITIALLPLGLAIMGVGAVMAVILFASAKSQAKSTP